MTTNNPYQAFSVDSFASLLTREEGHPKRLIPPRAASIDQHAHGAGLPASPRRFEVLLGGYQFQLLPEPQRESSLM